MDRFDNDQMAAYHGLSSIPAGVAFIPGGPGAGKTWWTLMMAVLAQAGRKHTRMLYLLDINKTVDDAAGKIQAIYNNLGLQRSVVRLYKSQWPKGHLADEENYDEEVYDENGFRISNADSKWTSIKSVDWTSNFLRQRDQIHHRELSLAATLDQMAWGRYKSSGLYPAIELALARMSDATQTDEHGADMKILRSELIQLYADTLDNIDFLATTPVAGRALSGMYQPDLVIFDECAHARELSTLIALAHFTPKAWFLVGDHRQDEPFVQSLAQPPVHLRISTMERAAINNAISHQLLVNHRAYGGLERLASSLFYDGKMRSGKTRDNLFPTSLQHLRKWLDEMAGVYPMYGDLTTPRLIVSETDNVRARKAGTSFWKPRHHEFVMDKV
ncbi:hypothetical protein B0H63DRAFT_284375 [Podospora didyma]|uniref:DNA2/NAM7 helicase helicase domain-containing protein n=1 Tax=Podospora didyma TaxID=330526 RepID=A0AAE0K890_9PEZI|nr:hypothetical protein B0H63DRAFT_284375 [Podospora didyma]